jgi:TolA-binding protein
LLALGGTANAQTAPPATAPSEREQRLAGRAAAKVNAEAAELFRSADTTYLVGDLARAGELYRQILTVAPNSSFTVRVTARLGDCAYEAKAFDQAVQQYRRAVLMSAGNADPEEQAAGVRADYMVGQSYLAAKQYTQAFGSFRRFIDHNPENVLVNKAYQSIGDAHMALEQFQQALDAYRMVGTVFDKKDAANQRITPGQRIYLRVKDADVNISDTPRSVYAKVTTTSGDEERVELRPLGLRSPVFIATVPTVLGNPIKSGRLNEAFPPGNIDNARNMLVAADQAVAKAAERSKELAELQRVGGRADPAGFEKSRAALVAESEKLNRDAVDLKKKACTTIDDGYRNLEALLAEWSPQQSLAALKARPTAPTTAPSADPAATAGNPAGAVDAAMAEALSRPLGATDDEIAAEDLSRRGMSQAEIDRIRLDVAATPTNLTSFDKRLTALTIWHRALAHQFQRLEISGSDTITVEYVDEIGPNGPNDPAKAKRVDTLSVASDARVALLTADGEQAITQAVLGGEFLIRVEDPDRDVTSRRDTISVVLCATNAPSAQPKLVEAPATAPSTAASAERATPALIDVPTTQPMEHVPLVVEGAPNITVKLTETAEHGGVFEAKVALSATGASVDGQTLPLDPKKRLRLSYQDERAIHMPDQFVHATQVDCVADRGGSVAAVQYRLTYLDLQARLARAVASGEIGKIYLEVGLESRGKSYLGAAQNDCREVSQLAGKSALGEEALYHSWRIYFYAGLLDESVAAANRLIAAYPLSEYCDDAMLAIGQASIEQGKKANEEAIAAGRTATLNRDLQRAVNQLEALVTKYPNSQLAPEALYLVGQPKISAGQTGLDTFERLAKQFPDSGFAARGLIQAADYYVSIADFRRAQECFGRVLIDYPDSPQRGEVLLRRGICQYKLGQNAEALQTLYQITEDHSGGELAAQARKYISAINQSRGEQK